MGIIKNEATKLLGLLQLEFYHFFLIRYAPTFEV